jgi:hypothetical protein
VVVVGFYIFGFMGQLICGVAYMQQKQLFKNKMQLLA